MSEAVGQNELENRVLELLGFPAHEARQAAMTIRRHNQALVERLRPLRQDRDKLVATIKAARAELEQQMSQERADRAARRTLTQRPFEEMLSQGLPARQDSDG